MIGIYKITNKENGWNYIGSSKSIENRWKQHIKDLEEEKHHCYRLQYDFNKYGIINFNFSVLELCEEDVLIQREQYHIDNNYNDGMIYNTKIKLQKDKNVCKYTNNKDVTYNHICDNKIIFPAKDIVSFENLTSQRAFLMLVNKAISENTKYIELSVTDYIKTFNLVSNSYYDRFKELKYELENVKINNKKVFKSCELDKNVLIVVLEDFIFENIKNNNYIKLNLTYEDIGKFKTPKTLSMMFGLSDCDGKEITLEKFRSITGTVDKYETYAEFNRTVVKLIEKDLNRIGYNLNIEQFRKRRKIYKVKISVCKK